MEQLISFLLSNFHFVIVVLGILFVLLRKSPLEKKPDGKPGSRPASGRMPDFGGGGLPRPQRPQPQRAQPAAERRPAAPPPVVTLPPRPMAAEAARPEERRERAPASDRQAVYRSPGTPPPVPVPWAGEGESGGEGPPLVSAAARPAREDAAYRLAPRQPAAHDETAAAAGHRPRRSELAQAVVWAEILGPPRSRKPHRR